MRSLEPTMKLELAAFGFQIQRLNPFQAIVTFYICWAEMGNQLGHFPQVF